MQFWIILLETNLLEVASPATVLINTTNQLAASAAIWLLGI